MPLRLEMLLLPAITIDGGITTSQPPTVACKMEPQLGIQYTRCIHVFAPTCMLSRCLLTKFLRRSSVGSLLRVCCVVGWVVSVRAILLLSLSLSLSLSRLTKVFSLSVSSWEDPAASSLSHLSRSHHREKGGGREGGRKKVAASKPSNCAQESGETTRERKEKKRKKRMQQQVDETLCYSKRCSTRHEILGNFMFPFFFFLFLFFFWFDAQAINYSVARHV